MDPGNLHPSVRFGLEGALLTALAEQRGESLVGILGAPHENRMTAQQGHGSQRGTREVLVNGLLDCAGGPQEAAAEAVRLVRWGHKALKIKVCTDRTRSSASRTYMPRAGIVWVCLR